MAHPEEQSPQVQVVQHTLAQHDLASETSAFCGAKLNKKKIAEKRIMDFMVEIVFKFRITVLKNQGTFVRKNTVNPKSKTLVGRLVSVANMPSRCCSERRIEKKQGAEKTEQTKRVQVKKVKLVRIQTTFRSSFFPHSYCRRGNSRVRRCKPLACLMQNSTSAPKRLSSFPRIGRAEWCKAQTK